ncbi:uncharacterized protein LOC120360055 [Solenopsis invicta]|uniref:uncharacterized protein LOC120360055 n=1 Tax=Solenopsis invicta TaxID=13686 RepID=UPI00193E3001|nr:uncharacterized protein LOC120360055 [Solenopsis invicta]
MQNCITFFKFLKIINIGDNLFDVQRTYIDWFKLNYFRTVSSLSDVAEHETDVLPEQYEDDTGASKFTDISSETSTIIHASPSMLTPTRVRTPIPTSVIPWTSTPNNVSLQTSTLGVTSRTPIINSRR